MSASDLRGHAADAPSVRSRPNTCFFEADAGTALARRAFVEGIGTLLLMVAIVGAGQMSVRLAGAPSGLGLLVAAFATAGALVGLIVAFGGASGGHFNPLITLLQWLRAERDLACTAAYVAAQLAGGVIGAAIAANLARPVDWQIAAALPTGELFASELLSSSGLMLVVLGCAGSGRTDAGPFAVGAWLTAAILATPTLSYANPAVAIAALFASGPVSLSGSEAIWYVLAELSGAVLALPLISLAYPSTGATRRGRDLHEMTGHDTI